MDSVCHYKTGNLEAGMMRTVDFLLSFARDDTISAAIKVLATSSKMTDAVQSLFQDDRAHFISPAEIRYLRQRTGLTELNSMPEDDESTMASSSRVSEDSPSSEDAGDSV
jgi:hypothetical protein